MDIHMTYSEIGVVNQKKNSVKEIVLMPGCHLRKQVLALALLFGWHKVTDTQALIINIMRKTVNNIKSVWK